MDNDWEFLHGRLDAAVDANLELIEPVPVEDVESYYKKRNQLEEGWSDLGEDSTSKTSPSVISIVSTTSICHLLTLPGEMLDLIMTFLGPLGIVALGTTCTRLSIHAKNDKPWQHLVQENIPGVTLTKPYPCKTFQELYRAHDPHWFLPKYKIWFCDYYITGKLIIARYDPRRGCVEGYRLVCERGQPTFDPWELDATVLIHSFEPRCRLHMDQPALQLDAISLEKLMGRSRPTDRFCAETPMRINERNHHGVFSNFLHTRPVEERPNMQLWPPSIIPARHRVRNISQESFVGSGHKPHRRSEVSNQSFRIRRWMEMSATTNVPGMHLGEEVYTYSTLDPKLYTPTEDKPYRGIWVGDFSGHGCEFLLLHQPDDKEPFDESKVTQKDDETAEDFVIRKKEERIYRGSLEAIKLTGDPNVPRGEFSWISDDISSTGYVRTAREARFRGARVVKSRGHIAARMFRNSKYVPSELIMISHNRLAQYWLGFGHISFFERVDIDSFLDPSNDPCPRPHNQI